MLVSEAVKSRHSVRAFLDQPVEKQTIEWLLDTARWAPSGGNLQPWHVYVLAGDKLEQLKGLIAAKIPQHPLGEGGDFDVYPPKLKEPYRTRRFKCGEDLYESIGVAREDKRGRLRQFANNYHFFGAPVGMMFAIDRTMQEGQWSALGMYIQTLMLLAREKGLHTCAQESWSAWTPTISEFLEIPDELMLYCGLALGYMDEDHPINNWRTERAELSEFVKWYGM